MSCILLVTAREADLHVDDSSEWIHSLFRVATYRRWGGGGERGGGGVLDRRDVLDLMHGRSRMTIEPRIPTMPGRGMSGFHRPRQTLLAPSEWRREVEGESHEG